MYGSQLQEEDILEKPSTTPCIELPVRPAMQETELKECMVTLQYSEQINPVQVQLKILVCRHVLGMCRHMRTLRRRAAPHDRLAAPLEGRRRRALERLLDADLRLGPLLLRFLFPCHLPMP